VLIRRQKVTAAASIWMKAEVELLAAELDAALPRHQENADKEKYSKMQQAAATFLRRDDYSLRINSCIER
jgi:hypothetical protein